MPRRSRRGRVPVELGVPMRIGWNLVMEGSGCSKIVCSTGVFSLQTTIERQGEKGQAQVETGGGTRPGEVEPEGVEVKMQESDQQDRHQPEESCPLYKFKSRESRKESRLSRS